MPATQSAILPDHILAAVLTLAQRESKRERLAFRGHDFQLQVIFNAIQKSKKFPLLGAFVFSASGPEPYSPALNESVSRLQLSGLIGRENPNYEVLFLRPAADRFFEQVLKSEFNEDQIRDLTEIASEFLKRVHVV